MITAGLIVIAYFIGAIPTGLVFGKVAGVDPRLVGSGRVGATNTYRTLGLRASIAVAVIDALKGVVFALLALRFAAGGEWGVGAVVLATVLGQVYSIYLLAQGGRGVATTGGAVLVLWPWAFPVVLLVGALIVFRTRTISAGSIGAAASLPLVVGIGLRHLAPFVLALALGGLVVLSHRDNIGRLRAGTESRIGT
ncbi:MAG: glycerol-3-phosphate 1-O-acyltransferase PlsY [Candidatus Dormibacteraceae bacterium]